MSTELIWEVTSTGSEDTEKLGQALGEQLRPPQVVELRADLGGGKTTFARGLVRGLGSDDPVSSPTFTLSKKYTAGKTDIWHLDFYRLTEPGVLKDQLEESLADKQAIVLVEWGDIVKDVLPDNRLIIKFEPTANDPNERKISITYPENLSSVIKAIETNWQVVEL